MRTGVTIWFVLIATLALAQLEDFGTVNFKKADSIAGLFPKHSLADLQSLAIKLTNPLPTEVEKFRAIFVWVCQNIDHDYPLFLRFKNHSIKRTTPAASLQWNKEYANDVFKILRTKHRTTCTGYAYLIRELATRAGLPCTIINGYGRTAHANVGGTGSVNHSWNAVQLNSKWYLCDATWSSGWIDGNKQEYIKRFDDTYFLLSPSLFALNHFPEDFVWFLTGTKPKLADFLNGSIVYAATLRNKVLVKSPTKYSIRAQKGEPIQFHIKYDSSKIVAPLELRIIDGGTAHSYFPSLEFNCETSLSITHAFKSRGVRTLHILFDNSIISSYQVWVK